MDSRPTRNEMTSSDSPHTDEPNEEVVDAVAASSVRASLSSLEDDIRRKTSAPTDPIRSATVPSLTSIEDAIRRKTTIASPIASLKEDITRLGADFIITDIPAVSLASPDSLNHEDLHEEAQSSTEIAEHNVETLASLEDSFLRKVEQASPPVERKDFEDMNEMISRQIQPMPGPDRYRVSGSSPGAFATGGRAPFFGLGWESRLTPNGLSSFTPTITASSSEGLVEAHPVVEADEEGLVAAEPVHLQNKNLFGRSPASIAIACVLGVSLLAAACLIVALVVLLDGSDDDTIVPAMEGMQKHHTPKDDLLSIVLDSGLEEPQLSQPSARTSAFEWLAEDPNLLDYTTERVVQRYALATLYHSTQGPLWTYDSNWLSYSHHECDWFNSDTFFAYLEIETSYSPCNNETGVYERLWLPKNNLNGTLPEEIFALTSLQSVEMLFNLDLRGTICTEIGKLTNMEKFSLLHTSLDGTIPSEIGLLNKLKVFYLAKHENNAARFHGTIPPEYWNLTSLEEIAFTHQNFSGRLPTDLTRMTALQALGTIMNPFTGSIPTEWGRLSE